MKNLLFLAAILLLASCQPKEAVKPNVVFVLTDQWRAQDLGFAGNDQVITPHLDNLAKDAVVFPNAVSNIPVCTPARASLMTGKYPLSHGLFYNDKPLRSEEICIAEVYKENGYQTGYIGKWHINGHPKGMHNSKGRNISIPADRRQGFDYWKVHECTHNYNKSVYYDENNVKHVWDGYDAIAQTKDAIQYMQAHKDNPFVLFVSYGPPHAPYQSAPKKYKDMYKDMDIKLRPNVPKERYGVAKDQIRGYYSHISALDDCVAELQKEIKNLGIEENTIFVFTSDHGDMLHSHAQVKKQKPWEESINIPFVLKYPAKLQAGTQMTKMFSIPDIMPTLLGMCNLPIPETVEGVDYSGQLLGKEELDVEAALITCPIPFHQWKYIDGARDYRGVRTECYTYVRDHDGPWLLYDNVNDPYQMNNVVNQPEFTEIQADLESQLQAILDKNGDEFLPGKVYMEKWGYDYDGKDIIPDHN